MTNLFHAGRLWVFTALCMAIACQKPGREEAAGPGPVGATPAATAVATPSPVAEARGPNERFYDVQAKLDPGGSFYLYADVKDLLRGLMDELAPLAQAPGAPPKASQAYAAASLVIERLGLYGISDLGMSVVSDQGLQRGKIFIGTPEGPRGLLALAGGQPHPFAFQDRIPKDAMLLAASDFDAPAAWNLLREVVRDLGGQQALGQLDERLTEIDTRMNVNIPQIIASLGGEFIVVADQDPAAQMVLPIAGAPLSLPAPRIVIMIRVKDDTLYKSLIALLAQPGAAGPESTEGNLRKVPVTVPPNPVWPMNPLVATDGAYCYLATHGELLQKLTAPIPEGERLTNAEEFQMLRAGLPTEGNGMLFVSARLKTMIQQVMQAVINNAQAAAQTAGGGPPANAARQRVLSRLLNAEGKTTGEISVRINQPDGILIVNRSAESGARILGAALAAPVAIMAAITVPNFLEAQTRAKVSRVRADLRTMQTALEAYKIDTNVYPKTVHQLTTPIAYLSRVMPEVFAPQGQPPAPYYYYAPDDGNQGWILWSAGPDGKYDLTRDNIAQAYDPVNIPPPSPFLAEHTYDPTNGTVSPGDVWRIQE